MEEQTLYQQLLTIVKQLQNDEKINKISVAPLLKRQKELSNTQIKRIQDQTKTSSSQIPKNQGILTHISHSLGDTTSCSEHFYIPNLQCQSPMQDSLEELSHKVERNTSEFLQYFIKLKKKKLSSCLLDENGAFVFYDDATRDLFEKSDNEMKSSTIFDLMFPLSLKHIKNNNSNMLMNFTKNLMLIKFSVLSESSRKKTLKLISKVKKNHLNIIQKMEDRELREFTNEKRQKSVSADEIYCKYLKCLQMTSRRVNIELTRESLNSLESLEGMQIHFNRSIKCISDLEDGGKQQIQFQAVICELKQSEDFEKFEISDLLRDKNIEKYEKKVQTKMQKITGLSQQDRQQQQFY